MSFVFQNIRHVSDSAFYAFEIEIAAISGLKLYRKGQGRKSKNSEAAPSRFFQNTIEPIVDNQTISGLAVPAPVVKNWKRLGPEPDKIAMIPARWYLAYYSLSECHFLILVPECAGSNMSAQAQEEGLSQYQSASETKESPAERPIRKECEADIEFDRLYVWPDVITANQLGSSSPRFVLSVPSMLLKETPINDIAHFAMSDDENTSAIELSSFWLLYDGSEVLIYIRSSVKGFLTNAFYPDFMRRMDGVRWPHYKPIPKSLSSLTARILNRSESLLTGYSENKD